MDRRCWYDRKLPRTSRVTEYCQGVRYVNGGGGGKSEAKHEEIDVVPLGTGVWRNDEGGRYLMSRSE